jgi:hypothetical protein
VAANRAQPPIAISGESQGFAAEMNPLCTQRYTKTTGTAAITPANTVLAT